MFHHNIKIGSCLLLAFIAVKILYGSELFIANTPRINPMFVQRLVNTPSYIAHVPAKIRSLFRFERSVATKQVSEPTPTIFQRRTTPTFKRVEDPTPTPEPVSIAQRTQRTVTPVPSPTLMALPTIINASPTQIPSGLLEYKPVMKGVYAAEIPETNKVSIKIEAGTKLKVIKKTIVIGGVERTINLLIPAE